MPEPEDSHSSQLTNQLAFEPLQRALRDFASERDWEQFHSPKNLAMALAVEASELLEIFQWLTEAESRSLPPDLAAHAAQEIADVQIYLARIADILGISYRSVRYQIDQARERYGYASNLQTYVRAAVDYGLDPMLPPEMESGGLTTNEAMQ